MQELTVYCGLVPRYWEVQLVGTQQPAALGLHHHLRWLAISAELVC